jgi:hypothetical protein
MPAEVAQRQGHCPQAPKIKIDKLAGAWNYDEPLDKERKESRKLPHAAQNQTPLAMYNKQSAGLLN